MYGKIFGAMAFGSAGMLLAWSPLVATAFAVLGAILGHFVFDREPEEPRTLRAPTFSPPAASPRTLRRDTPVDPVPVVADADEVELADALCPLFVELARVDSPVSQIEVRVVREFFEHLKFGSAGLEAVRLALKRAIEADVQPLESVVKRARGRVEPPRRVDVLRWLYDLALADGPLTNSESVALRRIVNDFNVSAEQLREVTAQFFGEGTPHYEALGLPESASDEEIRSAFRRLAAEHHPDKAASLGPEEARRAAQRFHDVKEAYEALKRLRGF